MEGRRYGCAAVVWEGALYVVGGHDGTHCLKSVERFDGSRWMAMPSMTSNRHSAAAVVWDGDLYAIGGFDGSGYLSSAERCSSGAVAGRVGGWVETARMARRRSGCAAVVI